MSPAGDVVRVNCVDSRQIQERSAAEPSRCRLRRPSPLQVEGRRRAFAVVRPTEEPSDRASNTASQRTAARRLQDEVRSFTKGNLRENPLNEDLIFPVWHLLRRSRSTPGEREESTHTIQARFYRAPTER